MPAYPTPYVAQHLPYRGEVDRDSHGNQKRTWGEPVDTAVYGWAAPQSTEPKLAGRERVVVALELFAPPDTPSHPLDRWRVDGELYDAVGEVEDYGHGPWQWAPGVVINLTRWEG